MTEARLTPILVMHYTCVVFHVFGDFCNRAGHEEASCKGVLDRKRRAID